MEKALIEVGIGLDRNRAAPGRADRGRRPAVRTADANAFALAEGSGGGARPGVGGQTGSDKGDVPGPGGVDQHIDAVNVNAGARARGALIGAPADRVGSGIGAVVVYVVARPGNRDVAVDRRDGRIDDAHPRLAGVAAGPALAVNGNAPRARRRHQGVEKPHPFGVSLGAEAAGQALTANGDVAAGGVQRDAVIDEDAAAGRVFIRADGGGLRRVEPAADNEIAALGADVGVERDRAVGAVAEIMAVQRHRRRPGAGVLEIAVEEYRLAGTHRQRVGGREILTDIGDGHVVAAARRPDVDADALPGNRGDVDARPGARLQVPYRDHPAPDIVEGDRADRPRRAGRRTCAHNDVAGAAPRVDVVKLDRPGFVDDVDRAAIADEIAVRQVNSARIAQPGEEIDVPARGLECDGGGRNRPGLAAGAAADVNARPQRTGDVRRIAEVDPVKRPAVHIADDERARAVESRLPEIEAGDARR